MKDFRIIDGHCDTLLLFDKPGYDFHNKNQIGHIDMDRLVSANVLLQFFAVFIETNLLHKALEEGLTLTNKLLAAIEKDSRLFLIKDSNDLNNLTTGKVGALLSLEGGEVINKNIALLDVYHRLGVRALTLTWNHRNEICDGIGEESAGGLTTFGKSVVKRMEQLKMIVDVSHLSIKGFWDCIEHYNGSILASHSNAKSLCGNRRNLDDNQIKAIAETQGLIGVNFLPAFLSDNPEEVTIDTLIDHMSYIGDLVGIQYVGLGSDFDGVGSLPRGINDVTDLEKLYFRMLERGFSKEDVEKVLYSNFFNYLTRSL